MNPSGPVPLRGDVRRYAWGSPTALPRLLGTAEDGDPHAELWLGAHPDQPAEVRLADGGVQALDALVAADPQSVLGPEVRTRFGDRLPYLLKVLASGAPLSLQVHPSAEQARGGYQAEQDAGVPQDAAHRRYKDPFHKPEMIVALTPFEALCGLRPVEQTRRALAAADPGGPAWARLRALLDGDDVETGTRDVLTALLRPSEPDLVARVAARCADLVDDSDPAVAGSARTVVLLHELHPGDPGVLVSLLLNRVTLAPGEALYLPAGNVHAYLEGVGVEVMASSDNVLRAGLTPKHVDVDEVLRVVDAAPADLPRVHPEIRDGVRRYRPGAEEFELAFARVDGTEVPLEATGPRIVLVLEGRVVLRTDAGELEVAKGSAALVPAAAGALSLAGTGEAVVAAVPG